MAIPVNKSQETRYNFDPMSFSVIRFWGRRPYKVAINDVLQIDDNDCFYYLKGGLVPLMKGLCKSSILDLRLPVVFFTFFIFLCRKKKYLEEKMYLVQDLIPPPHSIVMAFITGNSNLVPLLEGLLAQIHIDLS